MIKRAEAGIGQPPEETSRESDMRGQVTIGDIDPVGGLLSLAGFGLAIIALFARKAVRDPLLARRLKILAKVSVGVAFIGVVIFGVAFARGVFQQSAGTPIASQPTPNPSSPPPTETTPPEPTTPSPTLSPPRDRTPGAASSSTNSGDDAVATQKVARLDIETIEYRRLNLEGTAYAAYPSTQDLDFRFGLDGIHRQWAA